MILIINNLLIIVKIAKWYRTFRFSLVRSTCRWALCHSL